MTDPLELYITASVLLWFWLFWISVHEESGQE